MCFDWKFELKQTFLFKRLLAFSIILKTPTFFWACACRDKDITTVDKHTDKTGVKYFFPSVCLIIMKRAVFICCNQMMLEVVRYWMLHK